MDKEEDNYSAAFTGLDYSLDHNHHHQPQIGESSGEDNTTTTTTGIIEYMLNNPHHSHQQNQISSGPFCTSSSLDKLSFADVLQFADFGPKLALNQTKLPLDHHDDQGTGIDPVYFLKFPVLNDKRDQEHDESLMNIPQFDGKNENVQEDQEARVSDTSQLVGQPQDCLYNTSNNPLPEVKNKRKRPRTVKTSEEVESQRMTHIAVERNRRKQMNEHLRVLRSLMPGSYVQRGDQASIIGGAIEFVRELEQLLQCLESQKRRRLYGEAPPRQIGGDDSSSAVQQNQQPFFPQLPLGSADEMKLIEFETGLREETAENKSCVADVEVKLLGFDAIIKILSRRRPGQLIKTIAGLEDLQLNILHTNITTIEQTVLYSFNVKIGSEGGITAEDIASSVQQIFSFIHANSSM